MPTSPHYFAASYGGIDLLIAEISTEGGRDITVHSPSRGNYHALQDRGEKHEISNATIRFVDQPSVKLGYVERFKGFRDLVRPGGTSVFTHPILGAYRAQISNMSHRLVAEDRSIEVTCTILPEEEAQQVFPVGSGVSSSVGLEAVTAAADNVTEKLSPPGLTSPLPADAIAIASAWADTDELDAAAVNGAVATFAGRISGAVETFELTKDLSRWEAYRALILLGYQVRRAGEAAITTVATFIDVTIGAPQPLRAICARIYGPALAEARTEQVAKANRLRTPGLVRAGTVLKMPAEGASP